MKYRIHFQANNGSAYQEDITNVARVREEDHGLSFLDDQGAALCYVSYNHFIVALRLDEKST